MLKQNKPVKEIAKQFNANESSVNKIKYKSRWKHLTKNIDFNCKKQKSPFLSIDSVLLIIKFLSENKSCKEISKITNTSFAQVRNIRKKRSFQEYTKNIIFPKWYERKRSSSKENCLSLSIS